MARPVTELDGEATPHSPKFDEQFAAHVTSRGWQWARCPLCQRYFASKAPQPTCADVRLGCAESYGFIGRTRQTRYQPALEVLQAVRDSVTRRGFIPAEPIDVLPPDGDGLFVVAGVQVLDGVLLHGRTPPPGPAFFVQPCVKVKAAAAKVGRKQGISTSFVNLGTVHLDCGFADFTRHLDQWYGVLYEIGLDLDGLALIVENTVLGRRDLEFRIVNINYFGFEIGEATLLRSTGPAARTIADYAFALERVVWAVNGSRSYYSLVGPLRTAMAGGTRALDFVRTMTLLASAGVRIEKHGRGNVLRQLGRYAAEEHADRLPLRRLIAYCYDYWAEFLPPRVDLETCHATVTGAIDRAMNTALAQRLRIRPDGNVLKQDPDAFVEDLLRRYPVGVDRVKEALPPAP